MIEPQRGGEGLAEQAAHATAHLGGQRPGFGGRVGDAVDGDEGATVADLLGRQLPASERIEKGLLLISRFGFIQLERAQGATTRPGVAWGQALRDTIAARLGRGRPHPLVGADQRKGLAGELRAASDGQLHQKIGHREREHGHGGIIAGADGGPPLADRRPARSVGAMRPLRNRAFECVARTLRPPRGPT